MSIQQYVLEKFDGNLEWFVEECKKVYHQQRVNHVLDLREYLNGKHKILNRSVEVWNGKEYYPRTIVLNLAKNILNFESTYLLGNPITISGKDATVKKFKKVWRKGNYDRVTKKILDNVIKYGMCWEVCYLDENKDIQSYIVKPEDGYEVISPDNKYIGFIEHYVVDGCSYYNVFYEDRIEKWDDVGGQLRKVAEFTNISGLPIRYKNDQNELDENSGRSSLEDIIPLIDQLEDVLSKFSDSFYKHHNPLMIISGQILKGDGFNPHLVGNALNLDDGSTADMISNKLDHMSFKEIYGTIYQALLTISNTPGIAMSSVELSNISETSLLLLYSVADVRGALNESWLKEGLMERLKVFKKLMELKGIAVNQDDFDELELIFQYARPKNRTEIVDNIVKLRSINMLSLETAVEQNPYTSNKAQEMDRLREEQMENNMGNKKDKDDKKSDDLGNKDGQQMQE
ncbi:hypothetical protein BAG01nite_12820 [Brevibacillus agri]|uniref:Phage portal protein n=1 Tax=Brevibacillus agri TaxID=51101 RepID=A0A3M8ASK7_9BACL|nr:phage portal protein [Brevibacillus agri]QAV13241.1 phage portal protein [Brevibacillus agri]RNB54119.1 phage portal protein [Brevibacillus agri]GED25180.1 hypothetical protein BAG01nite_12820 [Brevibacillus agri]